MITELTLSTQDLDKTMQFYAELLGLPFSLQNKSVEFEIGASRLIFREENKLHPIYHFAIEIRLLSNNRQWKILPHWVRKKGY